MKLIKELDNETINRMLDMYNDSFDLIKYTFQSFKTILQGLSGLAVFGEYDENLLVGYVIVSHSEVQLIVVDPEYRLKGIASRLLKKAESIIRPYNTTAKLGSEIGFLKGIPFDTKCVYADFFENRGYVFQNICKDYILTLNKTASLNYKNLNFRAMKQKEKTEVLSIVEEIKPSFRREYSETSNPIYLALSGEKIVGACIIKPVEKFDLSLSSTAELSSFGLLSEYKNADAEKAFVSYLSSALKRRGYQNLYLPFDFSEIALSLEADMYINFAVSQKDLKG